MQKWRFHSGNAIDTRAGSVSVNDFTPLFKVTVVPSGLRIVRSFVARQRRNIDRIADVKIK